MRWSFLFIFFISALAQADLTGTQVGYKRLELYSRLKIERRDVSINEEDWRWLRHKEVLKLGISRPDFRPFDITINGAKYEGITADVSSAISKLLDIDIAVYSYPNRARAIEALKAGYVDMLASANSYDVAGPEITLSRSYAPDQPALFSRLNESRIFDGSLKDVRIAVPYDYIKVSSIKKEFPGAVIDAYESRQKAMAAMAFGRADLYLGDMLSTNLLINENYFNYVKLERKLGIDTRGTSFAIRKDDQILQRVLNAAIYEIGDDKYTEIVRRWAGGTGLGVVDKVQLNSSERAWITKHPVVRVAISVDQAPLAFMDTDGNFSGIASDVLKIASARTGLKFVPISFDQLNNLSKAVLGGNAELAVLSRSPERENFLRFSQPFAFSPFAIMTREDNDEIFSINQLKNRRVAIPKGHVALEHLRSFNADVFILETANLLDSMSAVSAGDAAATITPLNVARFYTQRLNNYNLHIANVMDDDGARFTFAMDRASTELQSILDKVIDDIPPDELNVLGNRWRGNPVIQVQKDYGPLILKIVGGATLLLGVSILWNVYLRRQITRRRIAEDSLNEQLQFMQALINGTPHPIYVRDRQGRLIACNEYYLNALDRRYEQVMGKLSTESAKANKEEAYSLHLNYMSVMETGTPLELDRPLHVKGGLTTIYHWIYPYKDAKGEVQGVICGWVDISERGRLVEELKKAKDRADEASRAKTTFLATMSHEIRTPMNAIIGMLELALKGSDKGRLDRSLIEVAHDSANSLLDLIGDILDIVKIESGALGLSPRRSNIRELSESVLRVFDGLARQKNLALVFEFDAAVNCEVLIDPVRYKQILSNLISNSIKFTERGWVNVKVSGRREANSQIRVDVVVEDSGVGISDSDQKRIFKPFEQASGEGEERNVRGGTGLGLTICRSLAEMMGGDLSLQSKVGQGTCVKFELLLNTLDPMDPVVKANDDRLESGVDELNVLVVDDHSANRLVISEQLNYLGHNVSVACDGLEGIKCWRDGGFDLVITDCNMPVMNGYELAENIRKEELLKVRDRIIIFGFTANAQSDELERCVKAGMDDCLFKPVTIDDMQDYLRKWFVSEVEVETAEQEEVSTPQSVAEEPPVEEDSLFNLDAVMDISKGRTEVFNSLLKELVDSNRNDLESILSLGSSGDLLELADYAHKIKGAAKIISATRLIQSCQELEVICRNYRGEDLVLVAAIELLDAEVNSLEAELIKAMR